MRDFITSEMRDYYRSMKKEIGDVWTAGDVYYEIVDFGCGDDQKGEYCGDCLQLRNLKENLFNYKGKIVHLPASRLDLKLQVTSEFVPELLPCPYCGPNTIISFKHYWSEAGNSTSYMRCENCFASGPHVCGGAIQDWAKFAWNCRGGKMPLVNPKQMMAEKI